MLEVDSAADLTAPDAVRLERGLDARGLSLGETGGVLWVNVAVEESRWADFEG